MFTSLDLINEHDDDEIKKYTTFRQRNYPAVINNTGGNPEIEITSILKNGKLDNKDTYLGEYMAHTFLDYYTSHHFMRSSVFNISSEQTTNEFLLGKKLTIKLLPKFKTSYDPSTENSFYTGNILFIRLNDNNTNTFIIFYIDYGFTQKKETKVYYYLGDIQYWNGYFYDPYMRKMKIMLLKNKELEELNLFLKMSGSSDIFPPTQESQVDASTGLVITRNKKIKTNKIVRKSNKTRKNNGLNIEQRMRYRTKEC